MPGKLWKPQEEQLLRQLWESGVHNFKLLAEKVNRSEGAIREKINRMGLRVVISAVHKTTTPVSFKEPLLTHEEVLQVLAGAIKKGGQPKLDKVEIMRLKVLIDAAKTYDSVLEKFERWIEIESRLLEMDKKIAELKKTKVNA